MEFCTDSIFGTRGHVYVCSGLRAAECVCSIQRGLRWRFPTSLQPVANYSSTASSSILTPAEITVEPTMGAP